MLESFSAMKEPDTAVRAGILQRESPGEELEKISS